MSSDLGLLFVESALITDLILLVVIGLSRFSVPTGLRVLEVCIWVSYRPGT